MGVAWQLASREFCLSDSASAPHDSNLTTQYVRRYYVSVFLGGEWGETDFTLGGKLVCIALVAIGIELYAIPISVLFDAFQDVLGK